MKLLGRVLLGLPLLLGGLGQTKADFIFTGDIQTYTVSTTGTYEITVAGAQGGGADGGEGAVLSGDISLSAGEVLQIVVGGQGVQGYEASNAGGGGGSFVYISGASQPLLVAGGGGGASAGGAGGSGQTSMDGQNGSGTDFGTGGTSGNGGNGGSSGGGGAGWLGNGGNGYGFAVGGVGGDGPSTFAAAGDGGFGGGGSDGYYGGGGGGGYSGGGGGGYGSGGGGGSYYDASFTNLTETAGFNSGNGSVSIEFAGPVNVVPEPSNILLLVMGGFSFALFGWRRRKQLVPA